MPTEDQAQELCDSSNEIKVGVTTELMKKRAKYVRSGDMLIRAKVNSVRDIILVADKVMDAAFDESEGSLAITIFLEGNKQWTCHRDEMIYLVSTKLASWSWEEVV